MTFSMTWLPEVLRRAGLKVAESEGWTTRGRGDMGIVRGMMLHHTATAAEGNMPSLALLKTGRRDLPGPLSQLGLGRDGTYYIIAAGRANHAGVGLWQGVKSGNSSFIGIEAENAGGKTEAWPDVQMDAYRRGVAAILQHLGALPIMCCAHREYALPKGRKIDPVFDMLAFRTDVKNLMRGVGVTRPLIPAADVATGKMTLRRGARGADVEDLQRFVGAKVDGTFGPSTEAAVRRFQREKGLVGDGIVGPKTWALFQPEDGAIPTRMTIGPVTAIVANGPLAQTGPP
jgi:peptidoglycan hydrolase-like protein with peptidoglycan-binding domain